MPQGCRKVKLSSSQILTVCKIAYFLKPFNIRQSTVKRNFQRRNERQTDKQTDIQIYRIKRQTDTLTDRQTYRIHTQTDTHTDRIHRQTNIQTYNTQTDIDFFLKYAGCPSTNCLQEYELSSSRA